MVNKFVKIIKEAVSIEKPIAPKPKSPAKTHPGRIPFNSIINTIDKASQKASDEIGEKFILPSHYYVFFNPKDRESRHEAGRWKGRFRRLGHPHSNGQDSHGQ